MLTEKIREWRKVKLNTPKKVAARKKNKAARAARKAQRKGGK